MFRSSDRLKPLTMFQSDLKPHQQVHPSPMSNCNNSRRWLTRTGGNVKVALIRPSDHNLECYLNIWMWLVVRSEASESQGWGELGWKGEGVAWKRRQAAGSTQRPERVGEESREIATRAREGARRARQDARHNTEPRAEGARAKTMTSCFCASRFMLRFSVKRTKTR